MYDRLQRTFHRISKGPSFPLLWGRSRRSPRTTALYPAAGRETRDTGGLGLGTFTVKKPREVHGDMEGGLAGAVATPRVACL